LEQAVDQQGAAGSPRGPPGTPRLFWGGGPAGGVERGPAGGRGGAGSGGGGGVFGAPLFWGPRLVVAGPFWAGPPPPGGCLVFWLPPFSAGPWLPRPDSARRPPGRRSEAKPTSTTRTARTVKPAGVRWPCSFPLEVVHSFMDCGNGMKGTTAVVPRGCPFIL